MGSADEFPEIRPLLSAPTNTPCSLCDPRRFGGRTHCLEESLLLHARPLPPPPTPHIPIPTPIPSSQKYVDIHWLLINHTWT